MYHAERAIFELRRGRAVLVTGEGPPGHVPGNGRPTGGVLVAAVEGLRPETLALLAELSGGRTRLVVTGHRLRAMGGQPGGAGAVSLELNGVAHPEAILRLASAPGAGAHLPHAPSEAGVEEAAGVNLARLGHLLPAVVAVPSDPERVPRLRALLAEGAILPVPAAEVLALASASTLEVAWVSEAPVPLEDADNAHFILFRESSGLQEHVAILVGDRESWTDPVPVRLHSACLTGDLFGSLRCDCGQQLRGSIAHFRGHGGGVLLYLAQEGRNIGLANKLRAYRIQGAGLDTIDADCALGFGPDERRYGVAVEMLRHLGIEAVELLTNNPEKMAALESAGIRVLQRRPLHGALTEHNLPYVRAKVERAGHWLHGMLAGQVAVPGEGDHPGPGRE